MLHTAVPAEATRPQIMIQIRLRTLSQKAANHALFVVFCRLVPLFAQDFLITLVILLIVFLFDFVFYGCDLQRRKPLTIIVVS